MLFDTHAHLDDKKFDEDREKVLQRARIAGVDKIISVSYDLDSAIQAIALADRYDWIFASVGIHPHEAKLAPQDYLDVIHRLVVHPKVVALGEMGLDYYRNLSPPEEQQRVFREQLALSREMELPVIIHSREAQEDVLSILRKDGLGKAGGVMHCFSESWEIAETCLSLGLYLSIAGPVTYPNASQLKKITAQLPLDKMLLETDCPYLAPQLKRGIRNEPAYVRFIAEEAARLKELALEKLCLITKANACRLFKIKEE